MTNKLTTIAVCKFGVSGYFGPKNITRLISYIQKDFELYQVLLHNFLCQNVLILPLYILLTRRITTFSPEGINTYLCWGIWKVWHRKSQTEN